MQDITAIVHVDMDGYASAGVVQKRFPGDNIKVMISNYGRQIFFNQILPGSTVFVLDFSLTADDFIRLINNQNEIVWCDHHKKNYEKIEQELKARGFLDKIKGIRSNDQCGAMLTWSYLFPDKQPPKVLRLVQDWDLWIHKEKDTLAFNAGMGLFDARPNNRIGAEIWKQLLSEDDPDYLKNAIRLGSPIQNHINAQFEIWCNDLTFQSEIKYFTMEGDQKIDKTAQILAANTRLGNSMFFDTCKNRSVFDGMVMFGWYNDIGSYRYSIYAPDSTKKVVDVALSYGGGGHDGAAGFSVGDIIIKKPSPVPTPTPLTEALVPYQKLEEDKKNSPLVAQFTAKNEMIALRSMSFMTLYGPTSIPALGINHPYLPSIQAAIRYSVDVVSPTTGNYVKMVVGYVLTKEGWYRVCLIPLDPAITMDALKSSQPDGEVINGNFWYYSKELPVHQYARTQR